MSYFQTAANPGDFLAWVLGAAIIAGVVFMVLRKGGRK